MRHRRKVKKFGKSADDRKKIFRNLATSVILYESVKTTKAKAKVLRGLVDRVINMGKKKSLTSRRQLDAILADKNATRKVIEQLSGMLKDRKSGYARIIPLGPRSGDGAQMAQVELLVKTRKIAAKTKEKAAPTKVKVTTKHKTAPSWLERARNVGRRITPGAGGKPITTRTTSK